MLPSNLCAPSRQRAVAALMVLAIFGTRAAADDFIHTVTLTSSFGPPTTTMFTSPSINSDGETSFMGSQIIPTPTDLWVNNPVSGSRLVAGRGQAAPGMAPGVTFDDFRLNEIVNSNARSEFIGFLTGPGISQSNLESLWSEGSTGNLGLIARTGDQAPSLATGVQFNSFEGHFFNTAGHTAYWSTLRGTGVNSGNDRAVWWADGSGPGQLIARSGDVAPGNTQIYGGLVLTAMNDSDRIVFSSGSSIWTWSPSTTVTAVAQQGTNVPGNPTAIQFGFVQGAELNDEGDIGFQDLAAGGRDWVRQANGSFRLVARSGTHAPGTPTGVNFNVLNSDFVLNGHGYLATWANLTGPGVDNTNNEGIWADGPSGLHLVARLGDQAPGTPTGVKFGDLNKLTINSAGQVAFTGLLTGPGVTQFNDQGIWAQRPDGSLQLVAREGDTIDVDNGPGIDLRTISVLDDQIFFFQSGNQDSRSSMFNDSGQFVFSALVSGNAYGVFVSNTAAVPEPSLLGIFLPTLVLAVFSGHRRGNS